MVAGFVIDNLTLKRIDRYAENLAFLAYLMVITISILLLNIAEEKNWGKKLLSGLHPFFLIAMQFAIGGLWSGFLVFYSRSADFVQSWPFLLLLVAQLFGNELLKAKYARLQLQVGMFYFVLFSYLIFLVPILVKRINTGTFILSGFVSLVAVYLFIKLLHLLIPIRLEENRRKLIWTIGGIFFTINVLYFTNTIPPIPLTVKDSGVYHSVSKNQDGSYSLGFETKTSWGLSDWFRPYQPIHLSPADSAYAFSAIFAPTDFSLKIFHIWQYYDETDGVWVSADKVPLSISGGREGGYRTYSVKSGLAPGLWRVNVETESGQILRRIKFKVIAS
ncbi:MAG: DUF2914 domain-containing protein [Candidatus Paceibacterota bacterium]|jgi:hypothetical protein